MNDELDAFMMRLEAGEVHRGWQAGLSERIMSLLPRTGTVYTMYIGREGCSISDWESDAPATQYNQGGGGMNYETEQEEMTYDKA